MAAGQNYMRNDSVVVVTILYYTVLYNTLLYFCIIILLYYGTVVLLNTDQSICKLVILYIIMYKTPQCNDN